MLRLPFLAEGDARPGRSSLTNYVRIDFTTLP